MSTECLNVFRAFSSKATGLSNVVYVDEIRQEIVHVHHISVNIETAHNNSGLTKIKLQEIIHIAL